MLKESATSAALDAINSIVPGHSLNASQLERAWSSIRIAENCGADIQFLNVQLRKAVCMEPDDYDAISTFMNEMIVD